MFPSEGWIKWTCPVWDGSLLIEFPPDCSSPKSSTNYFNVSLWSFWPLAAGSSTSGPLFCGWFNTHLFLTFNCNLCRLKTSAVFTLLCPAVIRHVWAQEILIINYIRWLFKTLPFLSNIWSELHDKLLRTALYNTYFWLFLSYMALHCTEACFSCHSV